MHAVELIENLGRRGIRLIADGDGIIVEPSRLLTDTDRAAIRAHKAELMALLADLSDPQSILGTCRRYGVALRIGPDGTLVVGKASARADEPTQPWPALLAAIEAHLEEVAALVEAGWKLSVDFPDQNTQGNAE